LPLYWLELSFLEIKPSMNDRDYLSLRTRTYTYTGTHTHTYTYYWNRFWSILALPRADNLAGFYSVFTKLSHPSLCG
jgi:predicted alpha-1,6-mannanase (GH76 family)